MGVLKAYRWLVLILATSMSSGGLNVYTSAPAGERPTCAGSAATIVGTSGNDKLTGTRGPDVIVGRGGHDTIAGRGGNDKICGDDGIDVLAGGRGSDVIIDPKGAESDSRSPKANGGPGADRLSGGRGSYMYGGPGPDLISGAWWATGDSGNDVLSGVNIEGGPGDDTLRGHKTLASSALYYGSRRGVRIDMDRGIVRGEGKDTLHGIEGVTASEHDDVFLGTDQADSFHGGSGNDVIRLGGDDDRGHGGRGNDVIYGGDGNDWLDGYYDDDRVFAGPGDDRDVRGGGGRDEVDGGPGDDFVLGNANGDRVTGGSGEDLVGGDTYFWDRGNDVVKGDEGHDLLLGGSGKDRMVGGSGVDMVTFFYEAAGGVTASLRLGTATGRGVGSDTLASIEGMQGTIYSDRLEGGSDSDILDPWMNLAEGLDVVEGRGGEDLLVKGASNYDRQQIDGGGGSDWLTLELDEEEYPYADLIGPEINGHFDIENLIGGPWANELRGGPGPNILLGGAGPDELDGGDGKDVLVGGAGQDDCLEAERVDGCESFSGGTPYYLPTDPRPPVCDIAEARQIPLFDKLKALGDFCDGFDL